MQRFRNKNDLLTWLADNAPRKAIANAMIGGRVELYGFFNPAPGGRYPGWIVKVTSKRKTIWYITININDLGQRLYTYTIKEIPWQNYIGGKTSLYAGDNPELYKGLKNEKRV